VNIEGAGEEWQPRHIRHVLASYAAQAHLSGGPVLLISVNKHPDGSLRRYDLITAGVHSGISHEPLIKGKHPSSVFACYIPFDTLIPFVDLLIWK